MRALTSLLLLLVSFALSGQESYKLKGRVIDSEKGKPLPFATIYYPEKKIGTTTDSSGEFEFYIPDGDGKDKVVISYLGYERLSITIIEFNQNASYRLKPSITQLSDITVSANNKKLKPKLILKEAIQKFNQSKNKETHIAYAEYKEAAFKDGQTIMYTQSKGYSIFANTKGWARYANYKFINEETRAYTTKPEWQVFGRNNPGQTTQGVYSSGGSILRAYRVLEEEGLFSSSNLKKYSVNLDSVFLSANGTTYALSFKSGFDKGTIHIDQTSLQIQKIEYSTKNFFSYAFFNSLRAKVVLRFNYLENTPYISSGYSSYQKEELKHVTELNILTQKNQSIEIDDYALGVINLYSTNPIIAYDQTNWTNNPISFEQALCEFCIVINPELYETEFSMQNGKLLVSTQMKSNFTKTKEFLAIKSLMNQLK